MSVKIPIDLKKYITEGEKEKLLYPKPPRPSKNKYQLGPDLKDELQYPTKKMATEEFKFKKEDIMEPGQVEKLVFDKEVSFPDEGVPKITVDKKTPQKYMSEGEYGELMKAKEFKVDEAQPSVKVDIKKYYLSFEKAKPFQKQFSRQASLPTVLLPDVIGYTFLSFLKWAKENPVEFEDLMSQIDTYQFYDAEILKEATLQKMAGKTLQQWMSYLKEKKVPRKIRRQFKHIWESALERGESEEYAARAAIDILPKRALEKPTPYHGKEKTGPIDKKAATIDDEIRRKTEEITKLQEALAKAQKELADLQSKKAEELTELAKS